MRAIYGKCPHCGMKGNAKTELEHIFMARRICENCKKEILIVNNKVMKPEDYKPPKSA